ncbi:MAG: phosphoglucosamine mutase [Candidatus Bathyarchaeia archaeon]|jgi:phosphoglucosamine mutase
MKKLFGTDGIRGLANRDLTPELALRLGKIFGRMTREKDAGHSRILIGKDTRLSGGMLEAAVSAGLASQGVDVILAGVIPTPGLAFLTRTLDFTAGLMITASHNPAEYNGIKFFSHDGFKITDQEEFEIEKSIGEFEKIRFQELTGRNLGTITRSEVLTTKYLEHLRQVEKTSLNGLRVVLDLANGATFSLAPQLVSQLGADVISICDKPDGLNINANCGSTHLENLQKEVMKHRADVGLAFDGDGDRLLAVDERGRGLDGDQIILIAARSLARDGKLRNNIVVTTVMSNYGLEEALQKDNVTVRRTPVGDRYVVEEMMRCGAVLGGEQSGHIIFLDHNTTGDGLITGVKLLNILKRNGEVLSTLASMNRYPQVQINVRVSNTTNWDHPPRIQTALSNAESQIRGNGRIIVRASGTEPLIRLMVEGKEITLIEKIAKELAQRIRAENVKMK